MAEPTPDLLARWASVMQPTYRVPALALDRGQGAWVYDRDGRGYLDLYAGIAVNALGHAHPRVVAAVSEQVARLGHVSNLFASEPPVALAERLLALARPGEGPAAGRVFFANSGSEANEAALKLVRRHGRRLDPAGRRLEVVAAVNSFHGRTFGALAITGQPAKQAGFEPLPGPVRFVPYGDAGALAEAVSTRTAAVVLEPVQGEAGVIVPPPGYLGAVRRICDAAGALFVLDEVQGGIGRTGAWFAHQHPALGPGVRPDVITLAKGLGGGLPLGAMLAFGEAASLFAPGDHASTFGGNPICCAAGLAVLDEIAEADLLAKTGALGERLAAALGAPTPLVAARHGLGLWWGVQLTAPVAAAVERAARAAGFLVNVTGDSALRLAPPLVLERADLDGFLAAWPGLLEAVSAQGVPAGADPEAADAARTEAASRTGDR